MAKKLEWKRLVWRPSWPMILSSVCVGHGLDYQHTRLITALPYLKEVNIGHSMICYALTEGLTQVTKKMHQCLNG